MDNSNPVTLQNYKYAQYYEWSIISYEPAANGKVHKARAIFNKTATPCEPVKLNTTNAGSWNDQGCGELFEL